SEASREGFKHLGWATLSYATVSPAKRKYIEQVASDSIYSVRENTTVYAVWENEQYRLMFDLNGASSSNVNGSVSSRNITYAEKYSYDMDTDTYSFTLPTPSRTGYGFKGWSTKFASTYSEIMDEYIVNNETIYKVATNTTLYAMWSTLPTRLTFNANKGAYLVVGWEIRKEIINGNVVEYKHPIQVSTQTQSKELSYGDKVATIPEAVRTGYTFEGYYFDDDVNWTTKITEEYVYDKVEDATVIASWSANTYYIEYLKGDDKAIGTMATDSMTYDEEATLSDINFTRDGAEFLYWKNLDYNSKSTYSLATFSNQAVVKNLTATPYGTVRLQAIWDYLTYELTFNANDAQAKNFGTASITISTKSVTFNKPYGTMSEASREGFKHLGWATLSYATTSPAKRKYIEKVASDSIYLTRDDSTLYAIWENDAVTLKFDLKGGTGSITDYQDRKAAYADKYTYDFALDQYIDIASPTKTGSAFYGWLLKDYATYNNALTKEVINVNDNISSQNNITLYALWDVPQFELTLNGNGGTYEVVGWKEVEKVIGGKVVTYSEPYPINVNDVSMNVSYGEEIGEMKIPTKIGYTFKTYNKATGADATEDKNVNSKTVYDEFNDSTVYASWSVNKYKVRFNLGSSVGGSMEDQEFTYDKAATLSKLNFQAEGLKFLYWKDTAWTGATRSDMIGMKATYSDGELIKNIRSASGAVAILEAVWTGKEYTVHYVANTPSSPHAGEVNNASGSMPTSTASFAQRFKLVKNAYTVAGYEFIGWATSSDGNRVYQDEEEVGSLSTKSDFYLYAKWQAKLVTIKFDKNEQNGKTPANLDFEEKQFYFDATISEMPQGTRTNYKFIGFATSNLASLSIASKGEVKPVELGRAIRNPNGETLYAIWVNNNYKLTLDVNGGHPITDNVRDVYFDDIYGYGKDLPDKNTPDPNKLVNPGYSFFYWATYSQASYSEIDKYKINNSTIYPYATDSKLYAIWGPEKTTISVLGNDGTFEVEWEYKRYNQQGKVIGRIVQVKNVKEMIIEAVPGEKLGYLVSEDTGVRATPVKTGGKIKGYATVANATENVISPDDFAKMIFEPGKTPTKFYAIWDDGDFIVTFDYKTTPSKTATRAVTYGKPYGWSSKTWSMDNHFPTPPEIAEKEFRGWITQDYATYSETLEKLIVKETDIFNKAEDITLYGLWRLKDKEYTLTIDGQGGTFSVEKMEEREFEYEHNGKKYKIKVWVPVYDDKPTEERKVQEGRSIGTLRKPIFEGHTFKGYRLEPASLSAPEIVSDTIYWTSTDSTIYANWTTNSYVIIFEKGTTSAIGVDIPKKELKFGEYYTLPTVSYIVDGYEFQYWEHVDYDKSTASSASATYKDQQVIVSIGGAADNPTGVPDKVTLKAIWETPIVEVTYNANDGKGSTKAKLASKSVMLSSGQKVGSLSTASRTGYKFLGWSFATNGQVIDENHIYRSMTDGKNLYAQWEAKKYIFTLNYNDGGVTANAYKEVIFDATPTNIPESVPYQGSAHNKDEVEFYSWSTELILPVEYGIRGYKKASQTQIFSTTKSYVEDEEKTLYAIYKPKEYPLSYTNAPEGSELDLTQQKEDFPRVYDKLLPTTVSEAIRKGFIFYYWQGDLISTKSQPKVFVITPSELPQDIATINFVAHWDSFKYTVTIHSKRNGQGPFIIKMNYEDTYQLGKEGFRYDNHYINFYNESPDDRKYVEGKSRGRDTILTHVTRDMTLYAVWMPFGGGGGGGGGSVAKNETALANPASNGNWIFDANTGLWAYITIDQTPLTGWNQIEYAGETSWYYFDENGIMQTGWVKDTAGNISYLETEDGQNKGHRVTGTMVIDGLTYIFDENGVLISGSQPEALEADKLRQLAKEGVTTGGNWAYDPTNDKWAYLSQDQEGTVVPNIGWKNIEYNGQVRTYSFDSLGIMRTGWYQENAKIYYFQEIADGNRGQMFTGTQIINGITYVFSEDGSLLSQAPAQLQDANGQVLQTQQALTEAQNKALLLAQQQQVSLALQQQVQLAQAQLMQQQTEINTLKSKLLEAQGLMLQAQLAAGVITAEQAQAYLSEMQGLTFEQQNQAMNQQQAVLEQQALNLKLQQEQAALAEQNLLLQQQQALEAAALQSALLQEEARKANIVEGNTAQAQSSLGAMVGTWEFHKDKGTWKYNIKELNGAKPEELTFAADGWYMINDVLGQKDWYIFENQGNVRTGWYTDTQGNTYYLNEILAEKPGAMNLGWVTIDGIQYYFAQEQTAEHGYGTLYKNAMTPDGIIVDENGRLVTGR
ncbi:MAG: InlB B-repeat-containing protein, partial [Eubacteriales bacterium]|nr:InlB B-repeat-containing protein [Eubacteriales bacterium]